jgi:hypothetical protein
MATPFREFHASTRPGAVQYDRLVNFLGSDRIHTGVTVSHSEGTEHDLDD